MTAATLAPPTPSAATLDPPAAPATHAAPPARRWDRLQFLPDLPPLVPSSAASGVTETDKAEVAQVARIVVPATAEVLGGTRPADQMARWMTPPLFDALVRRAGLAARILGPQPNLHVRVRRTQVQPTPSGACEVLMLLDEGERVRGAAARLERRRGRWVVASLEIG